jgi:hypothetical protein
MKSEEWFKLIYGDAGVGWLTVSHKRNAAASKRQDTSDPFETEWFPIKKLKAACARIEAIKNETNVWYGVCLRREKLTNGQRGSSNDVLVIPGFWFEADVKKGAFASKDAIMAFVKKSLPLRPTAMVDSGNGFHVYHLFKEPLVIEDADDLVYAAALSKGWAMLVKKLAAEAGASVDSVYDLARVLRVPGTFNIKGEHKREVDVVMVDGPRCNPSDFDQWLATEDETKPALNLDIVMAETAEPPGAKFHALYTNSAVFARTYDRKRAATGSQPLRDQSPSGYCLALANYTLQAGWSDQETANLLMAWRVKEKAPPKYPAWFAITIAKAKKGHEEVTDVAQNLTRIEESPEPDEKLAGLSRVLGLKVTRVVRVQPIDPSGEAQACSYRIETERGALVIPEIDILTSHTRMRNFMADRLKHLIPVRAAQWDRTVAQMLAVMVDEEAPIESSPLEEIRAALREYVAKRRTSPEPRHAFESDLLYKDDAGALWFSYERFLLRCRTVHRMHVGPNNLPRLLSSIGSEKRSHPCSTAEGTRTRVVFWKVPVEEGNAHAAP